MAASDLPLTADDVRRIADAVELADNVTVAKLLKNDIVGVLDIYRPDGDDIIGHLVVADVTAADDELWVGFVGVGTHG